MKLKKIIAMLSLFTLVSSIGVTNVYAAHDANPVVNITAEKLTIDEVMEDVVGDDEDLMDLFDTYPLYNGYTPYLIKYDVDGIDSTNDPALGAALAFSISSSSDTADLRILGSSALVYTGTGVNLASYDKVENSDLYKLAFSSASGMTKLGSRDLCRVIWCVKNGEQVNVTYTSAMNGAKTTTSISTKNGVVIDDEITFTVNGEATNVLTLGEQTGTAITSADEAINGKVLRLTKNKATVSVSADSTVNIKNGNGETKPFSIPASYFADNGITGDGTGTFNIGILADENVAGDYVVVE